jgi:hypothetical protein
LINPDPGSPRRGDVQLYIGPVIDLAGVGRLAAVGIIAPPFLGICSAVLFTIVAVLLRYRARTTAIASA